MENYFVTITGMNHYLGMNPYKVNRLVKLVRSLIIHTTRKPFALSFRSSTRLAMWPTAWGPFSLVLAVQAGYMTSLKTTHMLR